MNTCICYLDQDYDALVKKEHLRFDPGKVYTHFFCLKNVCTYKKTKNWGTWLKQINNALVYFYIRSSEYYGFAEKRFLIMMQSNLFTEKTGYMIKGTTLIQFIDFTVRTDQLTKLNAVTRFFPIPKFLQHPAI